MYTYSADDPVAETLGFQVNALKFITSLKAQISLPFSDKHGADKSVILESQLAAVLFENARIKHSFYSALHHANSVTLSRTKTQIRVLVFTCSHNSLNLKSSESAGMHFVHCGSPDGLILALKGMLDTTDPILGHCVLNTIIIENLSAYYWDLKCHPRQEAVKWYSELLQLCHVLKERYMCNVVVTMWDKNFERGFNSRTVSDLEPRKLDDLTYTPIEFFQNADYVLAARAGGNLQYTAGQWREL